ncbi:flagellar hook-length control protein FliK [Polynucleobacter paneuropaeus]|uniref:flagellar hook-length control protein FliK n=1 Tax=Polynucleobacter paneuropaeus TaxID=2527775 RepID=UPI001BFD252C|nr:flagellar hook-length control protein FliK [Polynucleobacter paneuropaeus]MBT8623062.1 flagellar hook-length control protein FliK [Polynucleobacter paneuropaeus]
MPTNPIGGINPTVAPAGIGQSSQATLRVGLEYVGKIISFDPAGIAEVQIGDQVFGMKLGNNFAVGDVLHFRFLGSDPNPTFLLLSAGANQSAFENVILSGTSLLIAQLQDEAQLQGQLSKVESLLPPMLQNPQNSQLTAAQLQNAIVMSGLFYESHLANFAKGKWPLNALMKEPQNRPNFNASQIVNKQLDALENQTIRWNGNIWPGQLMDWQVAYEQEQSSSLPHDDNTDQAIVSVIELDLPQLGKVQARLTLRGNALSVQLKAEKPQTENLFRQEISGLTNTFNANGQELKAMEVITHG